LLNNGEAQGSGWIEGKNGYHAIDHDDARKQAGLQTISLTIVTVVPASCCVQNMPKQNLCLASQLTTHR